MREDGLYLPGEAVSGQETPARLRAQGTMKLSVGKEGCSVPS
jgi:hypothetical protein